MFFKDYYYNQNREISIAKADKRRNNYYSLNHRQQTLLNKVW